MKRNILLGSAVIAAAMSMGRISSAADPDTNKFDPQESVFLRTAAQNDLFEERLGNYAAEHAATDRVKDLGKHMASEHEADLKEIERISEGHNVNLVAHDQKLTPQQQTIYDRLTTKAGVNFDKEYTKLLVAQHNTDLGMYKRERDRAADVAVREYAGKAATTLEDHLKQAKEAEKVVWGV